MLVRDTRSVIDQQRWLEPTSDVVQKAVASVLTSTPARRRVDDILNGVWLGHPLHPVLTDVPVGAWTVALGLDAFETFTGRREFTPGADAAVMIGIVGGLASAVTGLSQWQYTDAQPRRMGMAHALLNTAGLGLYAASALLRAANRRPFARLTATLAYGVVVAASYIGGDLAFDERVGVNHSPGQMPPEDFTPVFAEKDLPEGSMRALDVGDVRMMLVRRNGQVYALARECSHLGGPLDEGQLEDNCVICPWHGSRFALADGTVLDGPATFPQPFYAVRVRDGQIEVKMTQQNAR